MQRHPVSSSHLASVGFGAKSSTLEIEFLDGSIYEYYNVPQPVYSGLMAAGSHGEYLDAHVKKASYRYRKIR